MLALICDARAEMEIIRGGDALILRPRWPAAWANLSEALRGFDADRFDECSGGSREQLEGQEQPELDDLLG